MNTTILNREFQHPPDGWYQIESKGEHPNRAAGVVQVIDDEAAASIVDRFNADARAHALRHGQEMLVDHEHFADRPDKESRAYGWLQELQNREDGIYGRIRWTATGQSAVDGGDYRFFSTEYDPRDLKVLNDAKPRRVRPLRLDGLTVTNMNNNRGQRPITNRDNFPGASASGANQHTNDKSNTMKSIAAKLGLAPEASEDAILAEVTKLQNRITTLEPLSAENITLKNRLTALESEQCDGLLDLCGVKEDKLRTRLRDGMARLANREERLGYLADFGHRPGEAKPAPAGSARVLNRSDARTQPATAATAADDDGQELAEKIRNRASELKGQSPHRPFDQCWNQARAEIERGN